MDPIKQLAEELDRDRERREASMTPEQKRQSDEYLDTLADRIMLNGIRAQFPDADEDEIQSIFANRIEIIRRLEASR
jgi:hypothetical protein